jgi:hypothetical protein
MDLGRKEAWKEVVKGFTDLAEEFGLCLVSQNFGFLCQLYFHKTLKGTTKIDL